MRGNLGIPAKRRPHLREGRFEPANLGFRRPVIGLAKLLVERNRHCPVGESIRVLAPYADRGIVEYGDPELLAEQFFILVAGLPQRMALLGGREEPSLEDRRLEVAVRLFLDGCRKA